MKSKPSIVVHDTACGYGCEQSCILKVLSHVTCASRNAACFMYSRVSLRAINDAGYCMLYFRSVRAVQAALNCIRKATHNPNTTSRPRVVLVSDTPSLVTSIKPDISKFAEVIISFAESCYKHHQSP